MGLLDELFRHKSALSRDPSTPEQAGIQTEGQPVAARGLGAIAAAIGVQSDLGMPGEFEILLGDLLQRAPAQCIWPGRHNPSRVLRVPGADVAGGLAKGRAEVPLARLIALAPDVFRWEPGDLDDPRIRLPLQKLLQQIGTQRPSPAPAPVPVAAPSWDSPPGAAVAETPALRMETNAPPFGVETEVMSAHLAPIPFDDPPPAELSPPPAEASPPIQPTAIERSTFTVPRATADAPPAQPTSEPDVVEVPAVPTPIFAFEDDVLPDSIPGAGDAIPQPDAPISASLAATPAPEQAPHAEPASELEAEPEAVRAAAVPQEVRTIEDDAFAESIPKTVELRPQTDVPISTTLRAVVLGSSALSGRGEGTLGSPVLAPHYPKASPNATPVFLAPAPARPPVASVEAPAQPSPQESAERSLAEPSGEADFSALQSLFMTDESLDLAAVAASAAALPGVQACLITGARGTARAGQFPAGLDPEVLGALALELGGKVVESAARLHVGSVECTTVHREDCAVGIFAHEGVGLTVVLGPRGFVAGVRQRLVRATELLASAPLVP